jgi:hypothetical protein
MCDLPIEGYAGQDRWRKIDLELIGNNGGYLKKKKPKDSVKTLFLPAVGRLEIHLYNPHEETDVRLYVPSST